MIKKSISLKINGYLTLEFLLVLILSSLLLTSMLTLSQEFYHFINKVYYKILTHFYIQESILFIQSDLLSSESITTLDPQEIQLTIKNQSAIHYKIKNNKLFRKKGHGYFRQLSPLNASMEISKTTLYTIITLKLEGESYPIYKKNDF